MEIRKLTGIIVNERSYKESSKLLDIITKECGVVSVIAKGAKKLNSKLRSVSSKLTYAEFQVNYKEGKLSDLLCADIIDPFNNIRCDLLKISYASYITELAFGVTKQSHNDNIFDILVSSLQKINEGYDPVVISNILELKYLSYLGIKPNFNNCSICKSEKVLTASVEKGGFVCAKHHTNEKIMNSKTLKILRMLYYLDISKISKVDLSNEVKDEIDSFIDEYYDKYTGLYLKSKKFLKNIKNSYV